MSRRTYGGVITSCGVLTGADWSSFPSTAMETCRSEHCARSFVRPISRQSNWRTCFDQPADTYPLFAWSHASVSRGPGKHLGSGALENVLLRPHEDYILRLRFMRITSHVRGNGGCDRDDPVGEVLVEQQASSGAAQGDNPLVCVCGGVLQRREYILAF
jgi:hypothetical protein